MFVANELDNLCPLCMQATETYKRSVGKRVWYYWIWILAHLSEFKAWVLSKTKKKSIEYIEKIETDKPILLTLKTSWEGFTPA